MSQDAPLAARDFWNERYRSAPAIWSGQPNPHLVTVAGDALPGRALDVGAGEGADACWLAEQGWTVTAVDISSVAIERGSTRAAELGAQIADAITWVCADVAGWTPAAGSFDLVSVQFMHLPSAEREPLYARCAAAVAPGGTLLIVGHDLSDLQTTIRRPQQPDLYFAATDIAGSLGTGWSVVEAGVRPRTARDSEGNEVAIHDAILVARRRA